MSNFIDYLRWRGDLTLMQSPFCEVDNLLLAYLVYANLDDIAPGPGEPAQTLEDISELFFKRYSVEELKKDRSFVRMVPLVLKEMAKSRRFGKARAANYMNEIYVEKNQQFCAMEILLEDGSSYIAYRGTDDRIVGWKEDFYLSNGEVPAEKEAIAYLNRFGSRAEGCLRVGGHSKGGNLAVYAAAECERTVQDQILEVYNNDGPGFSKGFLAGEGLRRILPRVHRYIPESAVIGLLLEHAAKPVIIKSSGKGIMQHDGFSWQVQGAEFEKAKELNKTAQILGKTIYDWVNGFDENQREQFITEFFSILEAPGVETLTELQNGGLKTIRQMLKKADTLSDETREMADTLLKGLARNWMEAAL